MIDRTCSVAGCQRSVLARGWCSLHYNRQLTTGDLGIDRPARIVNPRTADGLCSIDGCEKPFFSRGWCSAHYSRWRRYGDLNNAGVRGNAPSGTKWCPRCRRYKSTDEFYLSRSTPCGFQSQCKRCIRKTRQERRAAGKDVIAEAAASRKRRALQHGARFERYSSQEIADRDGWVCQICRKRIGRKFTFPHPRSLSIDHIIPISCGGDDVRVNVQAAHLTCNMSKNNRGIDQLRLLG